MAEYDFTLVLTDDICDFTDDQVDALYDAGCDDATIAQRYGRVFVTFTREAKSLAIAVISAINDIRKANIGADVLRVDCNDLVTQAEIARRADTTRQAIAQYISGSRGPGSFPPPVYNLDNGQLIWCWCDVANWLFQQGMVDESVKQDAEDIAAINSLLEQKHCRPNGSAVVRQFSRHVDLPTDRSELQDA